MCQKQRATPASTSVWHIKVEFQCVLTSLHNWCPGNCNWAWTLLKSWWEAVDQCKWHTIGLTHFNTSATISSSKPPLITSCKVWSIHSMWVNPPSQTAAVVLAALSPTKQVTRFLSIIHASSVDKILLNRFWAMCLSQIGNVSKTSSCLLNL